MIAFGNTNHGQAIAAAAGCTFDTYNDVVISRSERGRLLGGAVYTNYTGASVVCHIAGFSPRWISRDLLWVGFDYPFNQLRCSRILGFVPSTNKAALALDYKLGFKYVTQIPNVFRDGDWIVLAMDRADCRWLKLRPKTLQRGPFEHGQQSPQSPSAA